MRSQQVFQLLVAAFAVVQALRYGRRALLFVLPGARALPAPESPASPRRLRLGAELEALGFEPVGAYEERGALGARLSVADALASEALGAYADVVDRPRSAGVGLALLAPSAHAVERPSPDGAGVVFFTPFADGAAVLTASFARPALVTARLQAGGLDGAALPAVLAAHQVAAHRFAEVHGPPAVTATLDARLDAARAWEACAGRRERRRAHVLPFGIVLVAFALLAGAARVLVG